MHLGHVRHVRAHHGVDVLGPLHARAQARAARAQHVVREVRDDGGREPQRRRRRSDDSSDDEGEEDDGPGSPSSTGATTVWGDDEVPIEGRDDESEEQRYERRLAGMLEELQGLVGFVRDGLRGVARAGVMPHLEMLAEALEGYAGGGGGWV